MPYGEGTYGSKKGRPPKKSAYKKYRNWMNKKAEDLWGFTKDVGKKYIDHKKDQYKKLNSPKSSTYHQPPSRKV
tara:strand:+ start:494 stop:715 length:222 start_codon:yes stop_codon:yes gene_type:complete